MLAIMSKQLISHELSLYIITYQQKKKRTFSYDNGSCWYQSNEPIEKMSKKIPDHSLPKTFEDIKYLISNVMSMSMIVESN